MNVSIKEKTKQKNYNKYEGLCHKSSGSHFKPTLVVHRSPISYKSLDSMARGTERFSRFLPTSQLYLSRYKTRENVVSRLIINKVSFPTHKLWEHKELLWTKKFLLLITNLQREQRILFSPDSVCEKKFCRQGV